MKYLLIILLGITPILSVNAQRVIEDISTGTCNCLLKNKVAEKGVDKLEVELGLCLIEQVGLYKKELKKAGYDPESLSFYETMGEKVGMQLAMNCPTFMSLIADMMKDEDSELRQKVEDKIEEKKSATQSTYIQSTTGIVQAVEYGDFVKIILKDTDGKRKELYWIDSFEGDEKIMLMASPDLLIGKTVNVDYYEEEAYLYKVKSYFTIKKITSLYIQ